MPAISNLAAASRREVVGRLMEVKIELEHLQQKGDDITAEDIEAGEAFKNEYATLKAANDKFAGVDSIGATLKDAGDYLLKPNKGMRHSTGGGGKPADDKGVEIGNRIDGSDQLPNVKGLFPDDASFFHAVRCSEERDSREKLLGWEEMQRKAPAGMFESGDSDGGALIPPEMSTSIYDRAVADDNYLANCDMLTVKGNVMSLPALDDSSRAAGTRFGGVQSYWPGEAGAFTGSRPKFRTLDLRLHKLTVLVYLTSELVDDSAFAIEQYVAGLAAKEIRFKTSDALVNGTGAGSPLGVLNAACTISVTKETNQAAASLVVDNIEKMWMRCDPASRNKAVFLHNNDVQAQLNLMSFPVGVGGTPAFAPIYQPQGGINNPSYSTLKGRPLIASEFCATLGTVGDLILVDWSMMQAISKGTVNTAMSMHVKFLTDELAYRFTFRLDAQPKWDKALTPFKGTTTTSPFVTLATRA